ncbi:hypothetical protein ACJX0J_025517, partial [Zea mays]
MPQEHIRKEHCVLATSTFSRSSSKDAQTSLHAFEKRMTTKLYSQLYSQKYTIWIILMPNKENVHICRDNGLCLPNYISDLALPLRIINEKLSKVEACDMHTLFTNFLSFYKKRMFSLPYQQVATRRGGTIVCVFVAYGDTSKICVFHVPEIVQILLFDDVDKCGARIFSDNNNYNQGSPYNWKKKEYVINNEHTYPTDMIEIVAIYMAVMLGPHMDIKLIHLFSIIETNNIF